MRNSTAVLASLVGLSCIGATGATEIDTIRARLSATLDKIETFEAEAVVSKKTG